MDQELYNSLGHDHSGMDTNLACVLRNLETSKAPHQLQVSMHNLHSSSVCIFVADTMFYLLHDTKKIAFFNGKRLTNFISDVERFVPRHLAR